MSATPSRSLPQLKTACAVLVWFQTSCEEVAACAVWQNLQISSFVTTSLLTVAVLVLQVVHGVADLRQRQCRDQQDDGAEQCSEQCYDSVSHGLLLSGPTPRYDEGSKASPMISAQSQ